MLDDTSRTRLDVASLVLIPPRLETLTPQSHIPIWTRDKQLKALLGCVEAGGVFTVSCCVTVAAVVVAPLSVETILKGNTAD